MGICRLMGTATAGPRSPAVPPRPSRAPEPPTHQHEGVEHAGDVVGVEAVGVIAVLPAPGAVAAPPRLLLARRAHARRPRGERVLQAGLVGRDPCQGAGPPAGPQSVTPSLLPPRGPCAAPPAGLLCKALARLG